MNRQHRYSNSISNRSGDRRRAPSSRSVPRVPNHELIKLVRVSTIDQQAKLSGPPEH